MSDTVGTIASCWRYPVKSMQGEEMAVAEVGAQGFVGDRAYAVVDAVDGTVASAKNPHKWPHLLACRARYVEQPRAGFPLPALRLTLPHGEEILSTQSDADAILSAVFGRPVFLRNAAPEPARIEQVQPDLQGTARPEPVTLEPLLAATFFDLSVLHLVTTATLARLREFYPGGQFSQQRFRPNLLLETTPAATGFVENAWLGRTLRVGKSVRLRITGPCSRCVMTTLAQGDLPQDRSILRTLVAANRGNVGVHTAVEQGGPIHAGDECEVDETPVPS